MNTPSRNWIRRVTATAMISLLLAMGVVIAQRFRRLRAPVTEVGSEEVVSDGGIRAVGVYTGFEFVERVAGKLIFALSSSRTLGLSSGWHEIEGVHLQFYNDGEPGPLLICEGASFNIETRDARLEGGIQIQMPNGAVLTTDAGQFEASSRRFTAKSEVRFVSGAAFGRARSASYDLQRDEIELIGDIYMRSGEGTTLTAPVGIYQRSKQEVVFPDGCQVAFQSSTLNAPKMKIKLATNDGPPRSVEFSGGVTARVEGLDSGGYVEAWMERATADHDGEGGWQIDATTTGPWITVRFAGGEGFFERSLRTWVLRGVIGETGILNMRAEKGVCLQEIPAEGPPRWAEAQTARVWFSDGQATDVELLKDVILRGDDIEGRGYRARISPSAGLMMLHGNPTSPERVLLVSDRGLMSCDRAQVFNNEGRTEARGNVQGEIRGVTLMGAESEKQEQPVHFAAEVLEVTEEGETYHLRENTRVWQGHRLLLADDVVYHHDGASLHASGHVRTTLPASQLELDGKPEEDVVVVARSLDYDQQAKSAVYRGNVRYNDPNHTLAASELSVFFDDNNEVTAVEAIGAVELVDLESGRRMTGQTARREVRTQTVTIEGSPVRLSDPEGNVVSGSSLTWNQADGTVSVAGETETIYYPEEEP